MSQNLFTLQAGQQFISAEVQEFLSQIVFGMPNWKWMSLTISAIALLLGRKIVVWSIIKIKKTPGYFLKKTFMQNFIDLEIEKGLSWVIISLIGLIVVDSLTLSASFEKYIVLLLKLFLSINVIRVCYLAADALGLSIQKWAESTTSQLDDHLAPFATKTLKVSVVLVGALVVLQNFGVNVTALLAGLGIGGVAIAFAAQDTVANVFGTITILLDGPFKLGDVIKIGDTEGTVTDIGFRSTNIKTYYNSVVTLPNSVVAKEKIDNLSKRDNWIRFHQTMSYTYEATPDQINKFCERLRVHLLSMPDIDKERVVIHLSAFADFSVNVLISFHYKLKDIETIAARTGDYLNLIHNFSTAEKLSFAYPTQTLIVQK